MKRGVLVLIVMAGVFFLSAAANIETVSCSDLKELDEPKKKVSRFSTIRVSPESFIAAVAEAEEESTFSCFTARASD